MNGLFVYGTLKRGQPLHRLLGSPRTVRPAWVHGRLLVRPDGYPVLEVPRESVSVAQTAGCRELPARGPVATSGWRSIRGEIAILRDPEHRLALLDRYEEYVPTRPSPYVRVAVNAFPLDGHAATTVVPERVWTYVRGDAMNRSALTALPAAVWSGRHRR